MKNECPIDRLMAFLDGEVSPGEIAPLKEHLAQCPSCRGWTEELTRQRAVWAPFHEAKAPLGFSDRVMARLPEVERSHGRWRAFKGGSWVSRWLLAGAASIGLGIALWAPRDRGTRPGGDLEVSTYFAENTTIEEQTDLGTEIEDYFL